MKKSTEIVKFVKSKINKDYTFDVACKKHYTDHRKEFTHIKFVVWFNPLLADVAMHTFCKNLVESVENRYNLQADYSVYSSKFTGIIRNKFNLYVYIPIIAKPVNINDLPQKLFEPLI